MTKYLVIIGILLPCTIYAQSNGTTYNLGRAKAIYIEALGSSGLKASLNYDMRFFRGHKGLGFRAGITQPTREGRTTTYSFPFLLNHINTGNRVSLEAGAGFVLAYKRWYYEDQNSVTHRFNSIEYPIVANIGIRFQPLKTGIIWRLYWAPNWRLGSSFEETNLLWFGTSLGIGFNKNRQHLSSVF